MLTDSINLKCSGFRGLNRVGWEAVCPKSCIRESPWSRWSEISPYLQANELACPGLTDTGRSHIITHNKSSIQRTYVFLHHFPELQHDQSKWHNTHRALQFRRISEHRDPEYLIIGSKYLPLCSRGRHYFPRCKQMALVLENGYLLYSFLEKIIQNKRNPLRSLWDMQKSERPWGIILQQEDYGGWGKKIWWKRKKCTSRV